MLLEMGYRLVCGCDRYYGWMRWIGQLTIKTPDHFASWDEGLDASRTTIQAGRNKPTEGWHITSIVSDQLPHWAGFWKQCQSVIVAQCPRTICVGNTYPFPTQSLGQIKLGLMSWYRTTWIRWIEKISVSNSFDLRSTCIVPISIIQTSVSYYPILANPLSSTQFCRSFSNSDHTASIQHPASCLSCLVLTAQHIIHIVPARLSARAVSMEAICRLCSLLIRDFRNEITTYLYVPDLCVSLPPNSCLDSGIYCLLLICRRKGIVGIL
jgi:hypothetical protein